MSGFGSEISLPMYGNHNLCANNFYVKTIFLLLIPPFKAQQVHTLKIVFLPKTENQQTKVMGLKVETQKTMQGKINYPTIL